MSEDVVWVKFVWPLQEKIFKSTLRDGYELRTGQKGEEADFARVSVEAYASDPTWLPMISSIKQRMTDRVMQTYDQQNSEYFCIIKDNEIVAVSGIAQEHWTDQNFLTGLCVLPGHQRQGLGLFLLATSLSWLRDRGLPCAQVYTEMGSVADEKVYTHFGSERVVGVQYVDPPKRGAD